MLPEALIDFGLSFREVHDEGNRMPFGQAGASLQELGRARVNGVRFHRNTDERIPFPFLDERLRKLQPLFHRAVVGRWKIVQHLSHKGAHAGFPGGLSHLVLEEIHVAKGRGAR